MLAIAKGYLLFWANLEQGGMVVWDEIQMPVQSVIRTFLEKRLLRLEQPYPRSCMAECIQKCIQMGKRTPQPLQLQGLHGARRGTRTPTPYGTRS